MDASPLLALAQLRRTSARTLAKAAVRELVDRDVLRLVSYGGGGRREPRPGLTEGSAPLPSGALLLCVARVVQRTPTVTSEGRVVRDLRRVAQRLVALGHELPDAALRDLAAAGLVEQRTRRVLGLLERRAWQRTPAGEQALQQSRAQSVGAAGDSGAVVGYPVDGSDDVDSSFDASFDSSSAGGGDGGDGGGGGGD